MAKKALDLGVSLKDSIDNFATDCGWNSSVKNVLIKGLEAIGVGAAIGAATAVATEAGLVAGLTAGAGIFLAGEATAKATDLSAEAAVTYAISQADTEEEAQSYADLVMSMVEWGLIGLSTVGVYKWVKGKAPALRNTFSKAKISELFGLLREKKAGATKINQAPYNSRAMETLIRNKYGDEAVTSSTLPKVNAKNVKLAGTRHPKTGMVFSNKGMPILDDIARVEVRIKGDLSNMRSEAHKVAATRQLKADIAAGKVDRKLFSDLEMKQIEAELPKIGESTWHHHEDRGRMQLVPEKIHQKTGHLGGDALWGKEKK